MMSLWDALRMNMMISYQELVRTFPSLADSGIVGDRGELYLSGLPEKGQVTLSWGENASTKCIFNYSLSTPESESGLIEQGVTCH